MRQINNDFINDVRSSGCGEWVGNINNLLKGKIISFLLAHFKLMLARVSCTLKTNPHIDNYQRNFFIGLSIISKIFTAHVSCFRLSDCCHNIALSVVPVTEQIHLVAMSG